MASSTVGEVPGAVEPMSPKTVAKKDANSVKSNVLPDLTDRLKAMGAQDDYLKYRNDYLKWRKGGAKGAGGEITMCGSVPDVSPEHVQVEYTNYMACPKVDKFRSEKKKKNHHVGRGRAGCPLSCRHEGCAR
mmetsp:Transcript_20757/g.33131  ORF Transcript_20757/g.33131 Transcript_20757/m.33131 type:complete len:132 (-) Transcript_20757:827-1222(-)